MRIALVIRRYHAHGGGAERWTDRHARRLMARGHEVHLVAESFGAPPNDAILHPVEISSTHPWWRPAGSRLQFARQAEKVVQRLPVDVVHDMGDGWCGDLFMPHHGTRRGGFRQNARLTPALERPLRRLAHRWAPRYREFDKLESRQYAPAPGKRFVALSRMVREDMCDLYDVPARSIDVVYNGIDVEAYSPARTVSERQACRDQFGLPAAVTYLIVAHNFRLKGLAPLISAFSETARWGEKVLLVVVGAGKPDRYRRLARSLDCEHSVRFLGNVRDPRAVYRACDVYVQPTYYDPCSLVALEALACGLPVITTRFNGAGELLRTEREGMVLDEPDDLPALTGALERYLDEGVRREAAQAARALAETRSLDRNLDDLMALYAQSADRRQAA